MIGANANKHQISINLNIFNDRFDPTRELFLIKGLNIDKENHIFSVPWDMDRYDE